eukprot:scaffold141847_cov14-Tisochrysis_lutea.AAC.1
MCQKFNRKPNSYALQQEDRDSYLQLELRSGAKGIKSEMHSGVKGFKSEMHSRVKGLRSEMRSGVKGLSLEDFKLEMRS